MRKGYWIRAAGLTTTALTLAMAMAACSGSEGEDTGKGISKEPNESGSIEKTSSPEKQGPLTKYDPPIEVTTIKSLDDGAMKFPAGESIDNNLWTQGLEQELGVKLKVEWLVPDNQYEQKLNVTIASDDLPDITIVSAVQLKQLVDNDMVEDLTDVYETYKSELTDQIMTSDGGIGLKQATFDGKLLAIPAMNGALDSAPVLWLRKDWLDNVGLQPPKTMDDLMNIAKAFTENDPDGNGQKDTYGLGLQKELFGGQYVLNGYFNGYHVVTGMPGNLLWNKDASGKLILGYVQPEAKTALSKLAEMYKAGYIEKDFAVKDGGKVSESVVSEKIGMFYGQHWNAFSPLPDAVKKNSKAEWRPYAIPSVDGSITAENVLGVSNFYVVKKGMKQPEAVIKILNYFLNKQNPLSSNYDARYHNGPNYPKESHSEFKYSPITVFHPQQNILIHRGIVKFGETKDAQSLSAWNKDNKDDLKAFTENFAGEGGEGKAGGVKTENWPGWIWVGPFGAYSVINEYVEKEQIVEPVFYGAPTPTMTAKQSTLEKLVLENYTKFIMGVTPIEQFDHFVQNWNSLGGAEITAEVNEWAASAK